MAWLNRIGWLMGNNKVEATIVIVGMTNSGKSTIMHQLKPRDVKMMYIPPMIPMGVHAEKFQSKYLTFVAFDLCDLNGFGNPWEDFYKSCDGIIFVVDCSDRFNMPPARVHLEKLLNNPILRDRDVPLLILANKCDNPCAMSSLQCSQVMDLKRLMGAKRWTICCSDALTGEGLNEGLDWLAHQLRGIRK